METSFDSLESYSRDVAIGTSSTPVSVLVENPLMITDEDITMSNCIEQQPMIITRVTTSQLNNDDVQELTSEANTLIERSYLNRKFIEKALSAVADMQVVAERINLRKNRAQQNHFVEQLAITNGHFLTINNSIENETVEEKIVDLNGDCNNNDNVSNSPSDNNNYNTSSKNKSSNNRDNDNNHTSASKPIKNQYAVADSNSSTPPAKSFVPCKVCGDKASGYHYGVTSCEGCKGFFRRSIQKQIEYRCLRDGKCLVIRLNRNRCQYCRFKKCLSVGMSRDSVRYGRVPKRSREISDNENNQVPTPESPESSDSDGKHLAVYDIILLVSQAHHANCDYTEEQTRGLIRRPVASPPTVVCSNPDAASSTAESDEMQRIWLWQQFAVHVTPTVQRVVEFAKRVPGFAELSQDDQLILIKIGFFELWLGQVARLTSDTTLTFFDGTFITKQQMEIIYDEEFVAHMFQFASTFNALALNDTELGLFCSVVLISPDRSGVTDVKAVQHHQDRLLDALKVQVGRNHASEPHVLSTVLMKLPELRSLGAKHLTHLDWFRMNWDKLKLPPLFAEIFDIPKCEDDLQ